jgi:hypothetical protein
MGSDVKDPELMVVPGIIQYPDPCWNNMNREVLFYNAVSREHYINGNFIELLS